MMTEIDGRHYSQKIANKAWTPGKKDIPILYSIWGHFSDSDREVLLGKIARLDGPAAKVAMTSLTGLENRWYAELTRSTLKAGFKNFSHHHEAAESVSLRELCKECLKHEEPRIRKAAAQAIGSSWGLLPSPTKDEILVAMKDAASVASDPSEVKALTEALGKSGNASVIEFLKVRCFQSLEPTSSKAIVRLTRDLAKSASQDDSSVLPENFGCEASIVAFFTEGVEKVALRTPAFLKARRLGKGALICDKGDWVDLQKNFLWREAGFLLAEIDEISPDTLVAALVRHTKAIVNSTNLGSGIKVRVRLGRGQSITRSFLWEFAEKLLVADCGLINDGRDPHWQLVVIGNKIVLVPKKYSDDRFAWRSSQIEGSSDPTLAAAIVTMAEINADETVYDPFCGGGTELILAGKLCGAKKLLGTDISADAINFARDSSGRAGIRTELRQCEALNFTGPNIDVVISNPPFGMRTSRGCARELLKNFFPKMANKMRTGGRMVMLSHAPSSTRSWAEAAGYRLSNYAVVKLGRMECELQSFIRS